jgi:hypothetical protein
MTWMEHQLIYDENIPFHKEKLDIIWDEEKIKF